MTYFPVVRCEDVQHFNVLATTERKKKKGESERNKKSKVLDELFFSLSLLFSDNKFFFPVWRVHLTGFTFRHAHTMRVRKIELFYERCKL